MTLGVLIHSNKIFKTHENVFYASASKILTAGYQILGHKHRCGLRRLMPPKCRQNVKGTEKYLSFATYYTNLANLRVRIFSIVK